MRREGGSHRGPLRHQLCVLQQLWVLVAKHHAEPLGGEDQGSCEQQAQQPQSWQAPNEDTSNSHCIPEPKVGISVQGYYMYELTCSHVGLGKIVCTSAKFNPRIEPYQSVVHCSTCCPVRQAGIQVFGLRVLVYPRACCIFKVHAKLRACTLC